MYKVFALKNPSQEQYNYIKNLSKNEFNEYLFLLEHKLIDDKIIWFMEENLNAMLIYVSNLDIVNINSDCEFVFLNYDEFISKLKNKLKEFIK